MSRDHHFVPHGVIPAVLLPFHDDLSIDEPSFRAHLRDVGAVQGLSAIAVNAHSTEVASCTEDEQRRVMEIAGEEVGGVVPIIHGVYADGSLEAARIARQAQVRGASALLVFPPAPFTLGQSAEMALAHFKTIGGATDLPLIVFQYSLASGQGYPAATLLGAGLITWAAAGFRRAAAGAWARSLFLFSIVYLTLLFVALAIDRTVA